MAYAENFRGGPSFRHNLVTSQTNFRPNILGGFGGMPPGKFCKITPKNNHLPLKIRILFIRFFIFRVWGGAMTQCPPPYASANGIPRSIGPINGLFKMYNCYTASQTYHPNFLRGISLSADLPCEMLDNFYIAIMIAKRIANRLQNILLWCLKNQKVPTFLSHWRSFLLTDNTVDHKYNFHNRIAKCCGK